MALESFSASMGAEIIGPLAYTDLSHLSDSFSWKEIYASFCALASISITCCEMLQGKQDEIVNMLTKHSKHTHFWVRWAVLDAIGHLSWVLGPVMILHHHNALFPVLLDAMSDPNAEIKAHVLEVLGTFSGNCSPDIIVLYLEALVQNILHLLKDDIESLAEIVLDTLVSIIVSSQEHFKNHYSCVVESLKDMIHSEVYTTELCAHSIMCILAMTDLVETNRFMDDAKELIETFQSRHSTLEADDPLKDAMDEVWVQFCLRLGIDFDKSIGAYVRMEKAQKTNAETSNEENE